MNDIAVANSGLLREYSVVDPRVRTLMMTVKQWAKEYRINSAKDNHISSYTWMNLVIFYLQCIGFLPNLQSPLLMEAVGLVPDKRSYWHSVNSLNTCTLSWSAVANARVWVMPSEFVDEIVPGCNIMEYNIIRERDHRWINTTECGWLPRSFSQCCSIHT